MMYLVENTFIDKETKELHEKGTIYKTDKEERAEELREGGFLGAELVVKEENESSEEETPKKEEESKGKKK
ncbi:hypothetical protein [Anaerosalibacter sp. Marseille-P3206]|uniref:hypothetical protein n=1 Tax=Anaerosalibacter sp. Marseille-P3206 TaxID=1871005 RepID=UPI0009857D8E|nr:hypothetical protein [Anaerosalibacter sp. Marseille-P3206]